MNWDDAGMVLYLTEQLYHLGECEYCDTMFGHMWNQHYYRDEKCRPVSDFVYEIWECRLGVGSTRKDHHADNEFWVALLRGEKVSR